MYSAALSRWTRGDTFVFEGSQGSDWTEFSLLKNFLFLSLGSNQYRARRVYGYCVINDGSTRRPNRKWFWRCWELSLRPLGLSPTFLYLNYGFSKIVTSTAGRVYHPKAYRRWFYGEARNRTCDPQVVVFGRVSWLYQYWPG